MTAQVNYAGVPVDKGATLTLGDNSRTGPANYQDILATAAIPNGAQVERITAMPLATTTATVLRIWVYDGAAWNLKFEVDIGAQVLTAGAAAAAQALSAVDYPTLFPIIVGVGGSLRASINDAQTGIRVSAEGGGF